MDGTIPREFAGRIAAAAAGVNGVRSALVCSADGAMLGAAGVTEPAREAALASFVAIRAEALPVDGDLRGMGKQLAGSKFTHLSISAPAGETLLYNLGAAAYLAVRVAPGRAPAVSGPLAAIVRRAATVPESSMRSS